MSRVFVHVHHYGGIINFRQCANGDGLPDRFLLDARSHGKIENAASPAQFTQIELGGAVAHAERQTEILAVVEMPAAQGVVETAGKQSVRNVGGILKPSFCGIGWEIGM